MTRWLHRALSFAKGYSSIQEKQWFLLQNAWFSKHAAALRGAAGQSNLRVRYSGTSLFLRNCYDSLSWACKITIRILGLEVFDDDDALRDAAEHTVFDDEVLQRHLGIERLQDRRLEPGIMPEPGLQF